MTCWQGVEPNHTVILTIELHPLQVPLDDHTMAGNTLPCYWLHNSSHDSSTNNQIQVLAAKQEKSQQKGEGTKKLQSPTQVLLPPRSCSRALTVLRIIPLHVGHLHKWQVLQNTRLVCFRLLPLANPC